MDNLRRLGCGPAVSDRHDHLVHFPVRGLVPGGLAVVVGSHSLHGTAELHAGPGRRWIGRLALTPLRHRPGYQPGPGLRNTHRLAGITLRRRRRGIATGLRAALGRGQSARRGRLYTGDRRAVHPPASPRPVLYRPSFLQKEVRRPEDVGDLRGSAAGRDGPGSPGRRAALRGAGDRGTGARLAVVAAAGGIAMTPAHRRPWTA